MLGMRILTAHPLRSSIARFALNCLAIALATLFSYEFHLNAATVLLLYLLIVVLQSLRGGFVSSAILAVIAVVCLDFFFLPPLLSFWISNTFNALAVPTFLLIALVITRLISKEHDARLNSEQRLTLAQSAARLGVWEFDLRTKVLSASRESF